MTHWRWYRLLRASRLIPWFVLALGCSDGTRPATKGSERGGARSVDEGAGGSSLAGAGGTTGSAGASSDATSAAGCTATPFYEPTTPAGPESTCAVDAFAPPFAWSTSGPLLAPISDASHNLVSIKDPTAVFFEGRWHVYATTASSGGIWNMVYLSFTDWSAASASPQYYMDKTPGFTGYHCAPQVFYFRPQNKWYLVYQSGPPQYSTADDLSKPETWTAPKSFYATEPETVRTNKGSGGWLDFWVICDETNCFLFFTDNVGNFYRARTAIGDFPNGFGEPEVVMKDTKENVFEACNVYRLKGTNEYLLLIEAFGPTGSRYFRSWKSDRLDGTWTPLAADWTQPFASRLNVTPGTCVKKWNEDISHGELLRDNYDETMVVDPCNLRLLYQGVDYNYRSLAYVQVPWRLALAAPRR